MKAYLGSTNRMQHREDPPDYGYSEPMKAVDAPLVEVEGRWEP